MESRSNPGNEIRGLNALQLAGFDVVSYANGRLCAYRLRWRPNKRLVEPNGNHPNRCRLIASSLVLLELARGECLQTVHRCSYRPIA